MGAVAGIREKTILVVDDDPAVCTLIQEILSIYGYHVVSVPDGLQAIDCTNRCHVDLVLMDIRLPYFSGYWFCDALKHKKNTTNIPVIIISASVDDAGKQKAYRVGACAVLQKPMTCGSLLQAVREYAL